MDTTYVLIGIALIQLAIIFGLVIVERREPNATLAWILGVVLLPLLGGALYLLLGLRRKVKRSRRSEMVAQRLREVYHRWQVARKARGEGADRMTVRTRALVDLGAGAAGAYACAGNSVGLLINGAHTYAAIRTAIEAAKDHIHIEFYIIQPDETGRALRRVLVDKAKAGLEVRVLCDGLGSMRLPSDFWDELIAAGGRAAVFAPVRIAPMLRRRDHVNFRNHRKIVVVDGKVGLTGGINIGREYLGLDPEVGAWRDTHVRIEGPAVLGMQQIFTEDWLHTTDELLDSGRYFPEPDAVAPGEATVQVIGSGPDRPWAIIHHLHFLAVAHSQKRIWLTTPYFVPDRVLQTALVTAALRGVDVRLLLPKKSDSRLVDWASRFYFGELLEAGVRIYEYGAGFLHAKTMVVDDWLATIGSSNMDIRSFSLNYEINAFAYDEVAATALVQQFTSDLLLAKEVSPHWSEQLSYPRRVLYAFAGLLSPLL